MQRTTPPFRADHVGSLLRTASLKQARAQRERGEITAEQLKVVEDREIATIIKRQEDIGLRAVTDGEFRRAFWNYDFLGELDGVEAYLGERKIKFQGPNPKPMMLRVTGKLGRFSGHPMLEHFKFVKAHTRVTPKMTIPSPSSLHFRYGRDAIPGTIYPDMEDFYRRLRAAPTPRRCAPSPMKAAAICSSTKSIWRIFAMQSCGRKSASAARIPTSCRRPMRG